MLFDGSHLDVAENTRQTIEVVAEAERYGAQVEGEIESVLGVEDGVGSDEAAEVHPVEVSAQFIEETGVYSFAPAIGTAHGLYKAAPELKPERVTELVEIHPIPMVLHGGTGLTEEQFTDLISRGCAKVNISTALKIAFVDAHREYLEANPGKHDPPAMLSHVRAAVKQMAEYHIGMFGSAGPGARAVRVGRLSRARADLRLRRRARRHRARRSSSGVQRDVRRGRPAGRRGPRRSTARSSRSVAARSGWPRC